MKLYELTQAIRDALDTSDDGELTDEQMNTLESLNLALDEKINSCCGLVREWEATNAAKQAEIDRLRAGMETKSNNVKRLKAYMQQCMEAIGTTKIETPIFTARIQKSPPSASLDGTMDLDMMDARFVRTKKEADNRAAIEHWKSSGDAPRGFAIKQGTHLRIS